MTEEKKEEYITLFQATKICSYSEPYLRLRARQGKLKSIKLGKKWMTTADWISDYVMRAKEWNDRVAAKKSLAEQNLLVGDPGEKPQTAPEVFQAAVAIAERLSRLILKRVGIDGVKPQAQFVRFIAQARWIVRMIPGEMQ